MTDWTKGGDGSLQNKDPKTGRTYIISEQEGGFAVEAETRGGAGRAEIGLCPLQSEAILKVMNLVGTAKAPPKGLMI